MPIYEYQCGSCGHTLEALQKITDDALTDCPACHQATLQKLVSATSFQLKGTGWYETDFKTKKQAEPKTETKSTESITKSSSDTTTSSTTSTAKTDTDKK